MRNQDDHFEARIKQEYTEDQREEDFKYVKAFKKVVLKNCDLKKVTSEDVNTFRELIALTVPEKVTEPYIGLVGLTGTCPNCGHKNTILYNPYKCGKCGKTLYWDMDDYERKNN